MIELIKQILKKWGCMHNWDVYQTIKIYASIKISRVENEIPTGVTQTLLCKKCGKFKKIKL